MMSEAKEEQLEGPKPDAVDGNILVDSTLDIVVQALRCNRCSFMLLDNRAEELRVGNARGLSTETISNARAKLGESIAGLVAVRRQPLLIRDIKVDSELKLRGIGGCKTDSLVSVPVMVADEVATEEMSLPLHYQKLTLIVQQKLQQELRAP